MTLQVPPKYLEKYLDMFLSNKLFIRAGRSCGKTVTTQHLIESGYFYPRHFVPMKPLRRKPLSWVIMESRDLQ